jgi:hypothetical protein
MAFFAGLHASIVQGPNAPRRAKHDIHQICGCSAAKPAVQAALPAQGPYPGRKVLAVQQLSAAPRLFVSDMDRSKRGLSFSALHYFQVSHNYLKNNHLKLFV